MAKLRVFGVLNHLANQYEMLKLAEHYDVEFTYLENNIRKWPKYAPRPMPDHLKWAQWYEPGKYDIAILHVDQQHIYPGIGKGRLYEDMNEVIQDIPKIVINHGSPMDDTYDEDMVINGGEILDKHGNKIKIKGMKEKIGDNFMLVNSYTANKRWGWGYPLIHGIEAEEWWDLPKEPRSVVQLSPAGMDKYNNRQLLTAIKVRVEEKLGQFPIHIGVSVVPQDWDDQRAILGKSLISITNTLDSPMPRSRTEAMLSGCCILTSKHHDANLFIEHGKNGFIVPDNPLSYAEAIYHLINFNYREAIEIGQEGKKTAMKYFSPQRYREDLWFILNEVVNGRKPEWDGKTTIYGKDYEIL